MEHTVKLYEQRIHLCEQWHGICSQLLEIVSSADPKDDGWLEKWKELEDKKQTIISQIEHCNQEIAKGSEANSPMIQRLKERTRLLLQEVMSLTEKTQILIKRQLDTVQSSLRKVKNNKQVTKAYFGYNRIAQTALYIDQKK